LALVREASLSTLPDSVTVALFVLTSMLSDLSPGSANSADLTFAVIAESSTAVAAFSPVLGAVLPIVDDEGAGEVVAIDEVVEDGAVLLVRDVSFRSQALNAKAAATAAAIAGTLIEKFLSMSFSLCWLGTQTMQSACHADGHALRARPGTEGDRGVAVT
jgi:hypothetical protein